MPAAASEGRAESGGFHGGKEATAVVVNFLRHARLR
jgi:hypothetical protein